MMGAYLISAKVDAPVGSQLARESNNASGILTLTTNANLIGSVPLLYKQ
jgi:hypothetical protein